MSREIVKIVYTYDELSDSAKTHAVDQVAERLGGAWWDDSDNENIAAVMVYSLAESFQSPGWDTYGSGDFPGIDGIKLESWALDQGQSIAVAGTLTRDNAPGLPWADGIDYVELTAHRSSTGVNVVTDDELDDAPDPTAVDALETAVSVAVSGAWWAGEKEAEYMTGTDSAVAWIEANAPEFDDDGDLV